MNDFGILLWLLTAHFIGDFVLQSHWMALNKSKANWPLFVHVCTYTATIAAAMLLIQYVRGYGDLELFGSLVGLNFVAHFITDWVTSRINARLWKEKEVHWFFVGVGFDQLIHTWTLGITASFLYNL